MAITAREFREQCAVALREADENLHPTDPDWNIGMLLIAAALAGGVSDPDLLREALEYDAAWLATMIERGRVSYIWPNIATRYQGENAAIVLFTDIAVLAGHMLKNENGDMKLTDEGLRRGAQLMKEMKAK